MKRPLRQRFFIFSIKDFIISFLLLLTAAVIAYSLQIIEPATTGSTTVPLLFMLAVLLISRFTSSYFYGVAASLVSVVAVNYVFTYPYFQFNLSIAGYPLNFLIMLTVAIVVSMMTTQIKEQEKIRHEIEREKMRVNLLRAVSHDIRTPLTSIEGSASAYLENHDVLSEEEKTELIRNVGEEAQWLIRVVENLLSITRIGSENARISKEPEAAEEIIGEAVVKSKKQFHNVRILSEVPKELLLVPMDGVLIEQVLTNLIENAVLHGKSTKNVKVILTRLGKNAVFSVEDDGNGIDPQKLQHIFDGGTLPTDTDSVPGKRSMGIGLSVCKTIVNAHGGDIRAENMRTGGARFQFSLPLAENADLPLRDIEM